MHAYVLPNQRHQADGLNEDVGALFRVKRTGKKLSGEELSNEIGISRSTLVKIEKGDETVAFGSYLAAARALDLEWMFEVFEANNGSVNAPKYYLSGASALSLPPEDGRPPALWYSSSLSNPKSWRIAGKHLAHTGQLLGVIGLWDATQVLASYGVTVPRIWAANPERAVFDLLVEHCEIKAKPVPNIQASDIDDVVDFDLVKTWLRSCEGFLTTEGRTRMKQWFEEGY